MRSIWRLPIDSILDIKGVLKSDLLKTPNSLSTTRANPLSSTLAVSHAVLLTGSQILRRGLRVVFALVAARTLGPEQFGIYALLIALVELLNIASGSGFADYLSRESAKDARTGWGLVSRLVLLRLIYAAAFGTALIAALRLLGYPRSVLIASAWMYLALVPRSASEIVQGVLRGIGRYGLLVVVELILGLALVLGAIVLLLHGGGLGFVIATEVGGAFAAGLVALFMAFRLATVKRTQLSWPELVRKTYVFNVYPLVGSLYDRQDVLLLSKLVGNFATGIYSVAYRAMGMLQLVPYGVLYSLLPALSRGSCEGPEKQRLEKAMGLLLSVAFTLVLGTTVFAGPFVRLVVGDNYAESAAAAKILIWAVIPMYINFALNIALLATGREKVFLTTSTVCLTFNLTANLILIPMFSWRAAAVVTVATELALLAQNVYWIRRVLGWVPMPHGRWRMSVVFGGLLCAAIGAKLLESPLPIGAICVVVFVAYLFAAGMITEFGKVWHPERGSAA